VIVDDSAYRGFACPQVGMESAFLECLVVEHARQSVQAFIEHHGAQMERCSKGLVPVLSDWLARDATFETAWNLAFGELHAALLSAEQDEIERSGAAVALRLHAAGVEGEWQLQLKNPARFCFDRWLLPLSGSIQVSATPNTVSVRTRVGCVWQGTTFQLGASGWKTTSAVAFPALVYRDILWTILNAESLSVSLKPRLFSTGIPQFTRKSVDDELKLLLGASCDAMSLIDMYADIYLPWVGRVIKILIPLPETPGMLNSASCNFAPGAITISNQPDRSAIAEMLVHEATHQYLYILKRLGPIDDGTDKALYFSPFRNMGRPILFIVFAYHAFGNVLLFYRMARSRGLPDNETGLDLDRKILQLEQQLGELEKALKSTKALTQLGRALWEPLHERLHE
jgi:HEXXH motif-containing protein